MPRTWYARPPFRVHPSSFVRTNSKIMHMMCSSYMVKTSQTARTQHCWEPNQFEYISGPRVFGFSGAAGCCPHKHPRHPRLLGYKTHCRQSSIQCGGTYMAWRFCVHLIKGAHFPVGLYTNSQLSMQEIAAEFRQDSVYTRIWVMSGGTFCVYGHIITL